MIQLKADGVRLPMTQLFYFAYLRKLIEAGLYNKRQKVGNI